MADEFASRGYKTLVLDTFNGDALPLNRPARLDMPKWTKQGSDGQNPHTPEAVDPIVEAAVNFLKKDCGVTWLGAVGYCFGGKVYYRSMTLLSRLCYEETLVKLTRKQYVVRHYKTGIDVGYIAHPTNVTETELSSIQGPLSIAAAEKDQLFPTDKRHRSEQILSERGLPYQINLYSGVGHGFAVRGDLNKRHELFAKEQAILQAVAWFDEYLLPQGN